MSHFPRTLIGAAIAAVLASPGIVWAQSADATLRGKAPANTAVTAKNVATGATRRTQTGRRRKLHVRRASSPARTASMRAPAPKPRVTLTVASTATLDLTASERRSRRSDEPMQEVTVDGPASERSAHLRSRHDGFATTDRNRAADHAQLPRVRRHRSRASRSKSTPRGAPRSAAARRTKTASTSTSTASARRATCARACSGQAGDTQGNPFPQLAIGEYKVITSNYKAEYDQISSAAITALTRSGTNTFEGQAFGTYTADNFRAKTPGENRFRHQDRIGDEGIRPRVRRSDHPGQLHFFFTYEAKRYETPTTVTAWRQRARRSSSRSCRPMPSAQLGAAAIGFDEDLFFAQAEPGRRPTRTASSCRRRFATKSAKAIRPASASRQSAAVDTDNDDKRLELSWKHSGNRWLNELQFTYEDAFFVPHISNAGTERRRVHAGSTATIRTSWPSMAAIRAPARTRARKAGRIANNITFTDITLVRRRSHDQGRRQVQGRRSDRAGRRGQQPGVLLRRDAGGRRHHSVEGRVRAAARGLRFHGRLQRQTTRHLRRRTTGRLTTTSR